MSDDRLTALRATAHPLRLRMLSLLTAAPMSAAEVARELSITHANASYHLRVLLEAGVVVIEGEERIRGGVAKRYRHPWQDTPLDGDANAVTNDERRQFLATLVEEVTRRFELRRETDRAVLSDAELWVSVEAWEEASRHLRVAADLVHGAAQTPRAEGSVHVSLTTVAFEMDAAHSADDAASEDAT